jgi:subtilase family protein
MGIGRRWLAVTVLGLIVLAGGVASAATTTSKAGAALMALHAEHAAHAARASGLPFTSSNPVVRVIQERVIIRAVADADVDGLKSALSALGMRKVAVFGRVISGEFPIAAIPALDGISSLRFARPSAAIRRTGSVTSQGDQAMRADIARGAFGVTGAGVQVGVLSDSFDCLKGAAKDVASDDLSPVSVVEEISDCAGAADEGRAMLQIVHDVAPDASLSFASAFNGEAAFASNILALKANGAKVIVDDIGYPDEPMFQDGIIAQAVDTVVNQGVAYFSAAGNDARQSYESVFRPGASFKNGAFPSAPGAPKFGGGTAHNFAPTGPADHMQRITIPSDQTLILTFQWDSPFFSSGGPGSSNDVDIYLLNAAGDTVIAGSIEGNIGGDPVEIFSFTNNTGQTADFNLMILLFEGPAPSFVKYILFNPSITIQEFDTRSSTVFGHPNAGGAQAVGAAAWFETPAFGVNPPLLEPFSSAGGALIFFDASGARLGASIIRQKPEIVAPDGGNTTFFGTDIPQDSDTSPNFFGTSAAAPHAAAVAALLLQKVPSLSPAAVYSALENTAVNMGPGGFDFDTGFGLIQADAALRFVSNPSLGLSLNRHTASPGDPIAVSISVANGGAATTQDVYFVITVPPALSTSLGCPGGDALIFLSNAFASSAVMCVQSAQSVNFPALARNLALRAFLAPPVPIPDILSFSWPPGLPPGNYSFAIFTTAPSAFADGNVGPADITAAGVDTLVVGKP